MIDIGVFRQPHMFSVRCFMFHVFFSLEDVCLGPNHQFYIMFSGNLIIQTQTDFESIDLQYRTQLVMVSTRLSMACLVRTGSTTRVTT